VLFETSVLDSASAVPGVFATTCTTNAIPAGGANATPVPAHALTHALAHAQVTTSAPANALVPVWVLAPAPTPVTVHCAVPYRYSLPPRGSRVGPVPFLDPIPTTVPVPAPGSVPARAPAQASALAPSRHPRVWDSFYIPDRLVPDTVPVEFSDWYFRNYPSSVPVSVPARALAHGLAPLTSPFPLPAPASVPPAV
jgi:hypothetical protein